MAKAKAAAEAKKNKPLSMMDELKLKMAQK